MMDRQIGTDRKSEKYREDFSLLPHDTEHKKELIIKIKPTPQPFQFNQIYHKNPWEERITTQKWQQPFPETTGFGFHTTHYYWSKNKTFETQVSLKFSDKHFFS